MTLKFVTKCSYRPSPSSTELVATSVTMATRNSHIILLVFEIHKMRILFYPQTTKVITDSLAHKHKNGK